MTNVLFIQPYASAVGGVDSVLLQLIEGLRGGYRCFVLLPERSPYAERYEAIGATVLYGPIAVFGKPTDAAYYWRNAVRLCRSVAAVRRIVARQGIHLIHSHKMETFGGNVAGKWLGVPTVQTVHELPRRPLVAYRFVAWLNQLLNDRVIVLCDRSREMFSRKGRVSPKVVKIYNGIEPSGRSGGEGGGSLRAELGLAPDDRIAITVARISPMKGLIYLLEAAAQLKAERPDVKFVIVGDVAFEHERGYREELVRKLDEWRLADTVYMLGLRRDVPELLAQSDLLVLPSVYDIFPTVVLEAMNAGLPVVATDVGGVPEMVRDGAGLLVPPQDAAALRRAIVRLLEAGCESAGRRARQLFLREFTRERYAERTRALYEEVLLERAAGNRTS